MSHATPPEKKATASKPTHRATQRWSYPFALRDAKAPDTMHGHFKALSAMTYGFFPLSPNGYPNGSLHFGMEVKDGFRLDDGFRCIADGEVIAYRLDRELHALDYSRGEKTRNIRYSLGFTLARHWLPLPGKPSAGDHAEASAEDGIYIYSLYTYNRPLQPVKFIGMDFVPIALPFWQGERGFHVGTRCHDTQRPYLPPRPYKPPTQGFRLGDSKSPYAPSAHDGATHAAPFRLDDPTSAYVPPPSPVFTGLNIRAEGHRDAPIIGLLPRGSVVAVEGTATHGWARIRRVLEGEPRAPVYTDLVPPEAATGWVFLDEMDLCMRHAEDQLDRVVVLDTPHPVKAGEVLGYLGENPGPDDAVRQYAILNRHPAMALEVFAGDDFPAYLERARTRAAALPDADKTVLVIEAGTELLRMPRFGEEGIIEDEVLIPEPDSPAVGPYVRGKRWRAMPRPRDPARRESATAKATGYRISADGIFRIEAKAFAALPPAKQPMYPCEEILEPVDAQVFWGERAHVLGRGITDHLWRTFPLDMASPYRLTARLTFAIPRHELDALPESRRTVDPNGMHWWMVAVAIEGGVSHAWVGEKSHPGTRWESPQAWPAFQVADGSTFSLLESFQRHAIVTGLVQDRHTESFAPAVSAMAHSEMIVRLEQAIDEHGTMDGKVTGADIAKARTRPRLAYALSRLIVRFKSHWSDDMDRWEALSHLMRKEWQGELERQDKLVWWNAVASKVDGFPQDPHVYHLHPLGWIDNFSRCTSGRMEDVLTEIAEIIASGESGSYEAYNTGTKNVPYDLVGHSFPISGPIKVTSQTINQILATSSLDGTNALRLFATGKYQTIFSTLKDACDRMKLTGDELYDASMQERVLREHLIPTAGGGVLHQFITKGKGSVDDAQLAAAKQWASIGVPVGMQTKHGRVSDGTTSFYDKKGVNQGNRKATERLRKYLT
jgi:hypothetical protein